MLHEGVLLFAICPELYDKGTVRAYRRVYEMVVDTPCRAGETIV